MALKTCWRLLGLVFVVLLKSNTISIISNSTALHYCLAKLFVENLQGDNEGRRRTIAMAAFTVKDQSNPCLFAGDRSHEKHYVDFYMSGWEPQRSNLHQLNYEIVAGYPKLTVRLKRQPKQRLIRSLGTSFKQASSTEQYPSEYVKRALSNLQQVKDMLEQHIADQKIGAEPFQLLQDLQDNERQDNNSPVEQKLLQEVMKVMDKGIPGPFADAEEHLIDALSDERNVSSVRQAMQDSPAYTSKADIFLHVYTNLECCDYCMWMLLRSYRNLKDKYAPSGQLFLVVSGHARYRGRKYDKTKWLDSMGVQWMIDNFLDKSVRKHVSFLCL